LLGCSALKIERPIHKYLVRLLSLVFLKLSIIMVNIVKIKGFHTCRLNGWEKAPFLSEDNKRQWLTQGYYFWTDSSHFAHKWGKTSIQGDYAIVECAIEMERKYLLDLVGSVEDQLYFQKIATRYHEVLKKQKPDAKQPTVNVILAFYRKNGLFPYHAIKAQDMYKEQKVTFIHDKNASLPLVTRQQLCLFGCAFECIKDKQIIHPEIVGK